MERTYDVGGKYISAPNANKAAEIAERNNLWADEDKTILVRIVTTGEVVTVMRIKGVYATLVVPVI